jgi:hypothetical protein
MDYLLKSSAIIALFFICYRLFLQRETFFDSNRWFLLIGLITGAFLPLVVIPIYIEYTPVASNSPLLFTESQITVPKPIDWIQLLSWIYITITSLFALKLIIELVSLQQLIIKNPKKNIGQFYLIEIFDKISPFSFFKWIIYNPKQFNKQELNYIINHEKVHAKEQHTLDVLIAQLCCILFWFNPLVWLYKKELQQNLEFIADDKAQTVSDCKESYQRLLLKASVPNHPLALTNNFYNSLIKKRIIMLHKSKSNKLNAWKYVLIIPALAIFLMSFNTKEIYIAKDTETYPIFENDFVVTANSTDSDLKLIKMYFKNKPVQIQFSEILRNSDHTLKAVTLNTKYQDGTDYTKRMSVSNTNSNQIAPFKISFNVGQEDIVLNFLEDDSNTTIGKHEVTFGKDNTIGKINPHKSDKSIQTEDNSLGENPLYIVEGMPLKKEDLKNKQFSTTGSIEQLNKIEGEKRFGKAGKDGAIIFNGKTTFNNNKQVFHSKRSAIVITKDFSEADLNLAKAQLEKEGLKIKIRGVKRNINGEIIAIKIEVSSKQSKASFNLNDDGPINPIQILFDEDGKNISIGTGRTPNSPVFVTGVNNVRFGKETRVVRGEESGVVVLEGARNLRADRIKRKGERTNIISSATDHNCINDCEHDHDVENEFHNDHENEDKNEIIIRSDKAYIIKNGTTNNEKNMITITNSDGEDEIIEIKKNDTNIYVLKSKDGKISSKNMVLLNNKDEDQQVEFVYKNKSEGNSFRFSSDKEGSPYILLNGKEITTKELDELDSDTIKSMNVLKGDSAVNKYGIKAKEGAIIITTK